VTSKHHDAELCRRLAEKVMGWEYRMESCSCRCHLDGGLTRHMAPCCMMRWHNKGYVIAISDPDFCCNPKASWMLEQRMAELGWFYEAEYDTARFGPKPSQRDHLVKYTGKPIPTQPNWVMGNNRLHATALAADAAIAEVVP